MISWRLTQNLIASERAAWHTLWPVTETVRYVESSGLEKAAGRERSSTGEERPNADDQQCALLSSEARNQADVLAMTSVLLVVMERDAGAWPPVAALSRELCRRGNSVSVLCEEPIEYAFDEARIIKVPTAFQSMASPFILKVLDGFVAKIERDELGPLDSPWKIWADAVYPEIVREIEELAPDVVVGSMGGLSLGIRLAGHLEVPVVYLNPGPYLGPNPPRAMEDDYPGFAFGYFGQCVLPPLLQSDLVLHATDQEFDLGFKGLPENHHYIGPPMWTPPGDAPLEMTKPGQPWITASVSMANQAGEMDLLRAIMEAADQLDARILLTAPDHDLSALPTAPSNVLLSGFVSHAAALKHSRLMLSHAGHGAVMRALWMGVPMVLTPWDRDQFAVAYRAARLGVARVIERDQVSAERLHRELTVGLDDSTLRATAAHHGQRLQSTNPSSTAADLINRLIES